MTLEEIRSTYEKLRPLNQKENWEYDFLQIVEKNLYIIEKAMFTIEKVYSVFPKHEDVDNGRNRPKKKIY